MNTYELTLTLQRNCKCKLLIVTDATISSNQSILSFT